MVQDGYFSREEVIQRLPSFLDGEHNPLDDRLLRDHLASCEKCLRKYRFERQVLDSVRAALQKVEIPPGLADRVAAILAIEELAKSEGRPQ